MSEKFKTVRNATGTVLTIGPASYISVGKNGEGFRIRGNGQVFTFDKWNELIDAIDAEKATYYGEDRKVERERQVLAEWKD